MAAIIIQTPTVRLTTTAATGILSTPRPAGIPAGPLK